MLLPPDQDIDRRRLVWLRLAEPLFDFVFDEQSRDSDFQRIGRAAIDSGYADEELKTVYWSEVVPAITGAWVGVDPVDPQWLEKRILRRPVLGYLWCLRPWWIWVAWGCWREIKKGIEFERRHSGTKTEKEPFESIEDIIHDTK